MDRPRPVPCPPDSTVKYRSNSRSASTGVRDGAALEKVRVPFSSRTMRRSPGLYLAALDRTLLRMRLTASRFRGRTTGVSGKSTSGAMPRVERTPYQAARLSSTARLRLTGSAGSGSSAARTADVRKNSSVRDRK